MRISILLLAFTLFYASAVSAKTYRVYYLGGQSNMDGYGYVKELPAELNGPVEGVYIFHGNPRPDGEAVDGRGLWAQLRPGHGVGFKSDGKKNEYSERFGVELTLARRLKELHAGANIALVKYSRGGTSIDETAARWFGSWEADFTGGPSEHSGINQYDHFLANDPSRLPRRPAGVRPRREVIFFPSSRPPSSGSEGECSAAAAIGVAERYEQQRQTTGGSHPRRNAPGRLGGCDDRRHFRFKTAGMIDGRVWNQGKILKQNLRVKTFVGTSAIPPLKIQIVDDDYGYSDPYHYDTAGYIDLESGLPRRCIAWSSSSNRRRSERGLPSAPLSGCLRFLGRFGVLSASCSCAAHGLSVGHRDLLHDADVESLEGHHSARAVRQQADGPQAQVGEDLGANAVLVLRAAIATCCRAVGLAWGWIRCAFFRREAPPARNQARFGAGRRRLPCLPPRCTAWTSR